MSRGISEVFNSIIKLLRKPALTSAHVAIELLDNSLPGSIYSNKPYPSIFQNVLVNGAPANENSDRSVRTEAKLSLASDAKKLLVGQELKAAHEGIMSAGEALAKLSCESIANYIRRLVTLIENRYCQIAFIGQMNAGKSTLINAFIGSPSFLPTEITPWTTVVTNLYFGVPKLPRSGAVFEFFQEDEWRRLAHGSGHVRTLAKELMPNFPWESLYDQIAKMRQQAEEKLGPRYEELLGQQHAHPVVTPELLEKYIAAESPLTENQRSPAGEYSIITKAAHLYCDLGSFFYPTVVIDTPGVNDPFLVRDEITRQNLERANILIIVVTARQPLSEADMDLLRILRGLRKDNFIIFINKIDEIENFRSHSNAIVERIKALISREFPSANIPIIVGSAFWAEVALNGDQDALQKIAQANDILPAHALIGDAENPFWLSESGLKGTLLSEAVLARSGVLDLALAVSDMLRNGPIMQGIRYTVSVLDAASNNGRRRAEAVATLAEKFGSANAEKAPNRAGMAAEVRHNLDEVQTHRKAIAEILESTEKRYLEFLSTGKLKLVEALYQNFDIDALLCTEHGDTPLNGASHHVKAFFPARLRMLLEKAYLHAFSVLLLEANVIAGETQKQILELVEAASEKLDQKIEIPPLPLLRGSPSVAALAEPMPTEFSEGLHARTLARSLGNEEKEQLLKAVKAHFETIAEKLLLSAEEELSTATSFILDHYKAIALGTLDSALEGRKRLLDLIYPARNGQAAKLSPNAHEELQRWLRAIREEGETYRLIEESIASIMLAHEEKTESALS